MKKGISVFVCSARKSVVENNMEQLRKLGKQARAELDQFSKTTPVEALSAFIQDLFLVTESREFRDCKNEEIIKLFKAWKTMAGKAMDIRDQAERLKNFNEALALPKAQDCLRFLSEGGAFGLEVSVLAEKLAMTPEETETLLARLKPQDLIEWWGETGARLGLRGQMWVGNNNWSPF